MQSPSALTTAELGGWVSALASLTESVDDVERVDRLRLMEEVKAALAAAQARETAAFTASQREAQEAAGVRTTRRGTGIGHQVALARRESPHRGGRLIGLADALVHEMPHTLAALTQGRISEWRATLIVQATACLSRADRAAADVELGGLGAGLETLGDRAVADTARGIADRLDPHAAMTRVRRAEADRRVSLRPLPDTMVGLFGVLPAAAGIAAHTALAVAADAARATGDRRTRGQIMADLLVARLTGREPARPVPHTWADRIAATTWAGCDSQDPSGAATGSAPDEAREARGLEIQLIMTDQSLFAVGPGADEPAQLAGYGSVPAPLARDLVAEALERAGADGDLAVWMRRLYAHPVTGVLTQMESTRRTVPGGLARFVRTRDRRCRTPWCGAPVRHLDHVAPVVDGGPTAGHNLQGLCEACNYAKQAPGWQARPSPEGAGHLVEITTPTRHCYPSRPPEPPGARRRTG